MGCLHGASGKALRSLPDAFTVSAELFGCADWTVAEEPDGSLAAEAGRCVLCAMVRKAHGPSPCRLFCLDPIEGMVRGIELVSWSATSGRLPN